MRPDHALRPPPRSLGRATRLPRAALLPRAAALVLSLLAPSSVAQQPALDPPTRPAVPAATEITLEQIMADPDWIGHPPERPYWADDSGSIYYSVERAGQPPGRADRDLVQIGLDGLVIRVEPEVAPAWADAPGGAHTTDFALKVFARDGDLFLRHAATRELTQLTRTSAAESSPWFMAPMPGDDPSFAPRIVFSRDGATLVRDLRAGLEYQPFDLRSGRDPADEPARKPDYLADQQDRFFPHIPRRREAQESDRDARRAAQLADPTRPPAPIYLGEGWDVRGQSLSPSGRWVLVRLSRQGRDSGKQDSMPNYVTASGYVESRAVRTKVGTDPAPDDRLVLVDLATREHFDLDLSVLPGIADDPLKPVRDEAEARRTEAQAKPGAETAPAVATAATPAATPPADPPAPPQPAEPPAAPKAKPRQVSISDMLWNRAGDRAVIQVFSADNKDRWIAAVDLTSHTLTPLERDSDEAWINRGMTDCLWMRDDRTLLFVSERTGFAQLYTRDPAGPDPARPLAEGPGESTDPDLSRDGRHVYFLSNRTHPGGHEVWRVGVGGGPAERVTSLGGRVEQFSLSPDGTRVLARASFIARPPELFVAAATAGAAATRLTTTVTEAFASIDWVVPEVVAVPSRHGAGEIWSRVYDAEPGAGGVARRPAVVFVHGAGYLQNAHLGWSYYFREFMFHSLLARRGFVVLDMDYRASAGYGRDWRTAIYRRMGTPELEDLADGVAWLADQRGVDPRRVGVYGGSYGGFLTLMALFRQPDLFACGAALRPVTDWAHYHTSYTANILNTPGVDPGAFEASSPIEFAAGLEKPLLICHGMQDDNVLFQDTVRLAQRLIDLGKADWEVAMYPIEPHGFTEPASWLDEYRRILALFDRHLARPRG